MPVFVCALWVAVLKKAFSKIITNESVRVNLNIQHIFPVASTNATPFAFSYYDKGCPTEVLLKLNYATMSISFMGSKR